MNSNLFVCDMGLIGQVGIWRLHILILVNVLWLNVRSRCQDQVLGHFVQLALVVLHLVQNKLILCIFRFVTYMCITNHLLISD